LSVVYVLFLGCIFGDWVWFVLFVLLFGFFVFWGCVGFCFGGYWWGGFGVLFLVCMVGFRYGFLFFNDIAIYLFNVCGGLVLLFEVFEVLLFLLVVCCCLIDCLFVSVVFFCFFCLLLIHVVSFCFVYVLVGGCWVLMVVCCFFGITVRCVVAMCFLFFNLGLCEHFPVLFFFMF